MIEAKTAVVCPSNISVKFIILVKAQRNQSLRVFLLRMWVASLEGKILKISNVGTIKLC